MTFDAIYASDMLRVQQHLPQADVGNKNATG
jgi:hypothetical protein